MGPVIASSCFCITVACVAVVVRCDFSSRLEFLGVPTKTTATAERRLLSYTWFFDSVPGGAGATELYRDNTSVPHTPHPTRPDIKLETYHCRTLNSTLQLRA